METVRSTFDFAHGQITKKWSFRWTSIFLEQLKLKLISGRRGEQKDPKQQNPSLAHNFCLIYIYKCQLQKHMELMVFDDHGSGSSLPSLILIGIGECHRGWFRWRSVRSIRMGNRESRIVEYWPQRYAHVTSVFSFLLRHGMRIWKSIEGVLGGSRTIWMRVEKIERSCSDYYSEELIMFLFRLFTYLSIRDSPSDGLLLREDVFNSHAYELIR